MKDSDLRHLRRADLLALLEELSRENDRLREELAATQEELKRQQVSLSECGSLAEAALRISGVFEAADRARDTYLELVRQNHPIVGTADESAASQPGHTGSGAGASEGTDMAVAPDVGAPADTETGADTPGQVGVAAEGTPAVPAGAVVEGGLS